MKVLQVSESKTIQNYPRHSHREFELVFVKKGHMTIIAGGKSYEASENDILVIPPHTDHEGVIGEGFVNIYASIRDWEFSDVMHVHDYDGSSRALFLMLHRVMNERELRYAEISDKLVDVLLEYVKKYAKRTFKYDFVLKIKNSIYENLDNPSFRISSEVKQIGINTDYFRRCFFEEMGKTPVAYITELRMERAKNLLSQEPPLTVEQIAELCGFSDSFYFSKTFKKHTGLSPLGYRKGHR